MVFSVIGTVAMCFTLASCHSTSEKQTTANTTTTENQTVTTTDDQTVTTTDDQTVTTTDDQTVTTGLTSPIVDTNQGLCYDNDAQIAGPAEGEPFYGQDAQYTGNIPSYTDNGDGTITDNVTGLI